MNIRERLINVQKEFGQGGIAKNQGGDKKSFVKYKFRGIEDALVVINATLSKHRVGMLHTVKDVNMTVETNDVGERWYTLMQTLEVTFYCDEAGTDIDEETAVMSIAGIHSSKEPAKLTGQLNSYLTKELFYKAFAIPVEGLGDDDPDALPEDAAQPAAKKKKTTRKKAAKKTETPPAPEDTNNSKQSLPATPTPEKEEPVEKRSDIIRRLIGEESIDLGEFATWKSKRPNPTVSVDNMEESDWAQFYNDFIEKFVTPV